MRGFSTSFPHGGPGTGLLLLRIAVAMQLLEAGDLGAATPWWQVLMFGSLVLLLCLGLLTPVAGSVSLLCQLLELSAANLAATQTQMIAMATGVALILLGPGGYSLDAHLFGRRRLPIETPQQFGE